MGWGGGLERRVPTRNPSIGGELEGIFAGTTHCCKGVYGNRASPQILYYEHLDLNVTGVFLSANGQEMAVLICSLNTISQLS